MGIAVDLIIVAIIALSTFLAYKKGFVNLAIGLCAFFVAIVITFILYRPISNFIIYTTTIDEAVENVIYEKANDIMKEDGSEEEDKLTDNIIETTKNEMLPQTARNLAVNIVTGGVMIVLFLIIRITLRFITAFANFVARLPILDQMNKAGGIIYGILRGILLIYIALVILKIPSQMNPNNMISQNINQSHLGKTMYENNILNIFFK